jgi:hypothetical protein
MPPNAQRRGGNMIRNPADYSEPCFKKGRGAELLFKSQAPSSLSSADFAF